MSPAYSSVSSDSCRVLATALLGRHLFTPCGMNFRSRFFRNGLSGTLVLVRTVASAGIGNPARCFQVRGVDLNSFDCGHWARLAAALRSRSEE